MSRPTINAKSKGSRRERQARDALESAGFAVIRAAGSMGAWDLVAVRRDAGLDDYLPVVKLIQVKSNRWPRRNEANALRADAGRYIAALVAYETGPLTKGFCFN